MSRMTGIQPLFRTLPMALLILLSASVSFAASPHYKFIEGGWLRLDPDNAGSEDGLFAGGSFDLRNFHFFAEYGDPGPVDSWEIGGGWHGLLGPRLDLVAQASYFDLDFDDGLRLTAGIRWMLLENLEINGFFHNTDFDVIESNSFEANGIWDLNRVIGIGAGYETGDDIDLARVYVRFNILRRQ